jgi:CarD family transcriptional regulator
MYEVGDTVVYPPHGAGTIVAMETKTVLGEAREYVTVRIIQSDMDLMVPVDRLASAGVRTVMTEDQLEELLGVLSGELTEIPGNWNRRFRHNSEKLKSGNVMELGEVIRNLSLRERDKGISTGERQMLLKAKRQLASELQYALGVPESEALEWLTQKLIDEGVAAQRPGSA